MEEKVMIGGVEMTAGKLEFNGINILLIKTASGGGLGCGYLNLAAADKFGHVLATVSKVATWEDMLRAEVNGVSEAAGKLGITVGMSGLEALKLMHNVR